MNTTSDITGAAQTTCADTETPLAVRVLLLDDDAANLLLRSAVLRQNGYDVLSANSIEEASDLLVTTDIAVLDCHLGQSRFGFEAAAGLRRRRPELPILILSAAFEQRFDSLSNIHLLKDHSSLKDLLGALRSLEAKHRGEPVVVDASEFYYSRICLAVGEDVLVQILDADGNWHYVNDSAAAYLQQPRGWFSGRNCFVEFDGVLRDWREVLHAVTSTRETYIDRTRRGLLQEPRQGEANMTWSIIAFPIVLHDGSSGVVLSARVLD